MLSKTVSKWPGEHQRPRLCGRNTHGNKGDFNAPLSRELFAVLGEIGVSDGKECEAFQRRDGTMNILRGEGFSVESSGNMHIANRL